MLLRGLPPDSNVWRNGYWTQQDELLARVIEAVDWWGWVSAYQRGGSKAFPKPPGPVTHPDRPGIEPPEPPATKNPVEIARFFATHLKG